MPNRSDSKLPYDPMINALRTIPCFATGSSVSNEYTPGAGNNNIRVLELPSLPSGQDGVWGYFGCFLGVNPQIYQWTFPGTHHCVVAQIAYDGAPLLYNAGAATTRGKRTKSRCGT